MRWGMDPYAVANKAYETNGTVAYEAQLINAVINTSGAILGSLKIEWEGEPSRTAPIVPQPRRRDNNDPRDPRNEPAPRPQPRPDDETLVCKVSGRLKSDPDDLKILEQPLRTITVRNSPLWQTNPRLQLAYHATRSWARLYAPEILLGVYSPDELVDGEALAIEAETTPRGGRAPDRRDFVGDQADDAEPVEFSTLEVEEIDESGQSGAESAENSENNPETADSSAQEPENEQTAPLSVDSGAQNEPVSGAARPEQEDDSDGAAGRTGEPQPADQAVLSDLPVEPLEWATWRTESLAKIAAVGDMDAFNALKQELAPAMEQADDGLLDEIQSAFADKLLALTPEVRSQG
jgi:hypothetical protein